MTDDEKRALEFVDLAGPVLQSIGGAAGVSEISDVGRLLARMPIAEVVAWFSRWRVDLIQIDAGTMAVGVGVEVVADDGADG